MAREALPWMFADHSGTALRWGFGKAFSVLSAGLALLGTAYLALLLLTPLLDPYRFPIPYAVPIFDAPVVVVALGVSYMCFERHRVRQDWRSAVLGSALAVEAILAAAHILTQPDYPGTPGMDPGIAPYFFFLSYLAAFTGIALAMERRERYFVVSDRRLVGIIVSAACLGILIVLAVLVLRPLLPSPFVRPGRFSPMAIWGGGLANGGMAAWALWRARKTRATDDWFAPFLLVAGGIWLIGLTGFLLAPVRYGISWYVAGLARPIGVGVIFIGLMREQILLYRELAKKNADLAARERAARAHANESEQRFRDLVEGLDAIVWEAEENGRFTFVSQRAETILGYPVAQWIADADFLAKHLHPDDAERALLAFRAASGTGESQEFEYRAVAADGRAVWLRAMIQVIADPGGSVRKLRGFMVDITERKGLEDQFRHAQKMEALGRLAGGVAHDFNNLLTVIVGQAHFLRARAARQESLAREVGVIEQAAGRGAELTRQLVAFGRKQVLAPKVLDLNTVVSSMAAMLKRVIGEHIELVTRLDADLWSVNADPGQIEQVILNLAVNARDAMPHEGQLSIETSNVDTDSRAQGGRPAARSGQYVALTVRDTGAGMDKTTQARIFEPFFTTKERGGGTGLGLSTVDGIVAQSGGWIDVWSEPGRGTAFTIHLPRAVDQTPSTNPPAWLAAAAGPAAVIVVVEDEQPVRQMAVESLLRAGYSVIEASSGSEALALAGGHAGRIDVLVTDVLMPGMTGRELVDRLAPLRPDMKVLYMSGYTDDVALDHAGGKSGVAFLPKPFSPDSFIRKVGELLTGPACGSTEPDKTSSRS
jgi:PAS domain S-box-containing protein